MRYSAFLSYSHSQDAALASALQAGLQRLARPWYGLRGIRVFRDDSHLAANPALWPAIQQALDGSEHFVLLASPASARSEYVQREVRHWLAAGKGRPLLVLTEGDLVWDASRERFDREKSTALPACLEAAFDEEPLHLDLRWARPVPPQELSLRHPAFRKALIKLLAALRGVEPEVIESEERQRWRRTAVAGALVALTVVALAGGLFEAMRWGSERAAAARREEERARASARQSEISEREARRQEALRLAREAGALAEAGESAQAIRLALRAARTLDDVPEVEAALYRAVRFYPGEAVLEGHRQPVLDVAFSPDGRSLLTASGDGTARLWDVRTGAEVARITEDSGLVARALFSPDGRLVLAVSDDGLPTLWDVRNQSERAVLRGHQDGVVQGAFSADGRRAITASLDGTARVWDTASGSQVAVLAGSDGALADAALSPDGHRAVTAPGDCMDRERCVARLWDVRTGRQTAALRGHQLRINRTFFDRDGRRVLTVSEDGTVRAWSAATGARLAVFEEPRRKLQSNPYDPEGPGLVERVSALRDAALSPDGRFLATGSERGIVRIWNARTAAALSFLAGHKQAITRLAFSPDGRFLVSSSEDGTARIWEVATGKLISVVPEAGAALPAADPQEPGSWTAGFYNGVHAAAFSPDSLRVATAHGDATVRFWTVSGEPRPSGGGQPIVLDGHEGAVLEAAFGPAGGRLVTASRDRKARLWDARTGRRLAVLAGHEGAVSHAAFSPDGRLVLTAADDETARLWNATSGSPIAVLRHQENVSRVAFTAAGAGTVRAFVHVPARLVAVGSWLGLGKAQWESSWHRSWSPGEPMILTLASGAAHVWTLDGHPLDRLQVYEPLPAVAAGELDILLAAFSPDGKYLVVVTAGNRLRGQPSRTSVWLVSDLTEVKVLRIQEDDETWVEETAFSPNGRYLAAGFNDGTVRLWASPSGEGTAVLRGHDKRVTHVAFSSDGKRLVTSSEDGTARLWAVPGGEVLEVLRGHRGPVLHAAFSPDGRRLVTSSEDRSARLWALLPSGEALIELASRISGPG
jgi:WD40 repeat protein